MIRTVPRCFMTRVIKTRLEWSMVVPHPWSTVVCDGCSQRGVISSREWLKSSTPDHTKLVGSLGALHILRLRTEGPEGAREIPWCGPRPTYAILRALMPEFLETCLFERATFYPVGWPAWMAHHHFANRLQWRLPTTSQWLSGLWLETCLVVLSINKWLVYSYVS